ncbi:MAG: hypothetical protein KF775_03005 [Cyclobacteriaceae bacterium]|nr:hypothetical protein [Cytophagales bacterium]MBX2898589.1 hypothetical protein [Cyclobacteriaceae bacterium]
MEILVFKTSVQSAESVAMLTPVLDNLAGCKKWNFALDDCDRILRMEATVSACDAIRALAAQGFECEELE